MNKKLKCKKQLELGFPNSSECCASCIKKSTECEKNEKNALLNSSNISFKVDSNRNIHNSSSDDELEIFPRRKRFKKSLQQKSVFLSPYTGNKYQILENANFSTTADHQRIEKINNKTGMGSEMCSPISFDGLDTSSKCPSLSNISDLFPLDTNEAELLTPNINLTYKPSKTLYLPLHKMNASRRPSKNDTMVNNL